MEQKNSFLSSSKSNLLFSLILLILFSGCSTMNETHMSHGKLLMMIESGSAPTIIDVRSEGEYKSGHIPKAIHIPFISAYSYKDSIPTDIEEPLVLYCEHGPRAGIAKFGLSLAGFKKILYLEGHMTSWKKANLPMEK